MRKKEIKNLEELKQISFDLAQEFKIPQIVLLKGGMAVGKTQMAQYMAEALGFKEGSVHSPTFSIINFYKKQPLFDSPVFTRKTEPRRRNTQTEEGSLKSGGYGLYHVDLYRIEQKKELEDIAFWDIFFEPALVFIEWPQMVEEHLPRLWNKLVIQMDFSKNPTKRILQIKNC